MLIPPKQCAICRQVYTPVKRGAMWSQTCGDRRCRAKLGTRQEHWQRGLEKARATRQRQREARIAAKCQKVFGDLSEREQRIYAMAQREGYQAGFNTAVHAERTRRRNQGYAA
jgi:hypothetical protein